MTSKIFVTRPLVPDFDNFIKLSKEIFDSKWLTNMGEKHQLLETKIQSELGVQHCSLMNNGTLALMVALKALNLPQDSEVITTPFTFAASPHAIIWNKLKPVFCDIEPDTFTIDADKIESLITPNTSAILGVHVYGFPCNVKKIDQIAKKHNLKVIYDAAHAFSTEIDGVGIGNYGDISAFSFHSTKLFNSIEGGCCTCSDLSLKKQIDLIRNFGIVNENLVSDVGINAKMSELHAAVGLLNLEIYKNEQRARQKIKDFYDNEIGKISGIRVPQMPDNTTNSYQYYPIVIEPEYPLTRDELCTKFNEQNIFPRKYFYPVCSDFECYKDAKGIGNLDVTNYVKHRVICLPYYGALSREDLVAVVNCLKF